MLVPHPRTTYYIDPDTSLEQDFSVSKDRETSLRPDPRHMCLSLLPCCSFQSGAEQNPEEMFARAWRRHSAQQLWGLTRVRTLTKIWSVRRPISLVKSPGHLRKEANRATKGKKGLNDEDKSMLFAQGLLLEVHLKSTGGTQHSSRNSSSQKFQSDGRVTARELCRAWGKEG